VCSVNPVNFERYFETQYAVDYRFNSRRLYWIAVIGMGVSIGEDAVAGARAAVFKDVESWTVAGGNRKIDQEKGNNKSTLNLHCIFKMKL
jgi:hypothetical protein